MLREIFFFFLVLLIMQGTVLWKAKVIHSPGTCQEEFQHGNWTTMPAEIAQERMPFCK